MNRIWLHYRTILSYTGFIMILIGLLILTPLIGAIWLEPKINEVVGFAIPGLILVLLGIGVNRLFKQQKPVVLNVKEGGVIVLFSWLIACIFSALPFCMILNSSFTNGLFESVSGWTTTGLTLIYEDTAPDLILLWRSITQLAGGAGLAIIMLAAIAGPTGMGVSIAEGRSDQLVPNVNESAKRVLSLYLTYAFVGIISLRIAGMPLFDSINHAFTAVATGGFSTHHQSIGYWNSPLIETIIMMLMILGNLNFLTAYLMVHGRLKLVWKNVEIRTLITCTALAVIIMHLVVCPSIYKDFGKNIRVSLFESISAITGTGFSTVSYEHWSSLGFLILICLMIIGGGTCSTSGGLKQYRVYLLFKTIIWEITRPFYPKNAVVERYVWQGHTKDYVQDQQIRAVSSFVVLYISIFILGSGIIAGYGYQLKDAMFEFASALGTVGLSVGITSPDSPAVIRWTEIVGMFVGRLEFFVIFVAIGKLMKDILMMSHQQRRSTRN